MRVKNFERYFRGNLLFVARNKNCWQSNRIVFSNVSLNLIVAIVNLISNIGSGIKTDLTFKTRGKRIVSPGTLVLFTYDERIFSRYVKGESLFFEIPRDLPRSKERKEGKRKGDEQGRSFIHPTLFALKRSSACPA